MIFIVRICKNGWYKIISYFNLFNYPKYNNEIEIKRIDTCPFLVICMKTCCQTEFINAMIKRAVSVHKKQDMVRIYPAPLKCHHTALVGSMPKPWKHFDKTLIS